MRVIPIGRAVIATAGVSVRVGIVLRDLLGVTLGLLVFAGGVLIMAWVVGRGD